MQTWNVQVHGIDMTHILYVFIDFVLKEDKCGYTQALYPIEVQQHPNDPISASNVVLILPFEFLVIVHECWSKRRVEK